MSARPASTYRFARRAGLRIGANGGMGPATMRHPSGLQHVYSRSTVRALRRVIARRAAKRWDGIAV